MSAPALTEPRPAARLIAAAAAILALVARDAVFLDQGRLLSVVLVEIEALPQCVHGPRRPAPFRRPLPLRVGAAAAAPTAAVPVVRHPSV
ncbi:hypothetical protein [Streptomyces canus]|uniref:hypothetical protein n=1 Tax=Streptomyces canus TaxID=58343 RepID=UPI002DD9A534|nr:hypothetical protein [Streptomyces canus]WSD83280.1 hypothetical protein OG925_02675 [Streptomyces canus]